MSRRSWGLLIMLLFPSPAWADGGPPPNVPANERTSCADGRGTRQEEPSIAVSGSAVVVSYNDSRAACPQLGYQRTGWSYSLDGGSSFRDGGPLPGGTRWGADQWLVTGPDGAIYHSALSLEPTRRGIILNRGTASIEGIAWSQPIVHVPPAGSTDKPAMAIDPATETIYIAYTLFAGEFNPASGVWLLRSSDRAQTFEGPFQVAYAPPSGGANAVYPVVGLGGELHLAWKVGRNTDSTNTIYFARSTDGGERFTTPVVVAEDCPFPVPGTDGSPVFPQLAIDSSEGPHRGTLYLVWQTACPEPGMRTLGDVVMSRSTNAGDSWSTPVVVNSDAGTAAHPQPAITIDRHGRIWLFVYRVQAAGDGGLAELLLTRSSDGGFHFDPVEAVTDTPSSWGTIAEPGPRNYGEYITAVATADTVYVAYTDARFGDPDIFVIRMPVDATTGTDASPPLPRTFLDPVTPNPTRATATVQFGVERQMDMTLSIYDVAGRQVRTLARGTAGAGLHSEQWDGRDGQGAPVAAGVYLLELRAGSRTITRKVVLTRIR